MVRMRRRHFMKTVTAAGTGLLLGVHEALGQVSPQAAPPNVPVMRPLMKPDPTVRRVLVMFKCHFDAGFIDTQANVVRRYFQEYFPKAIEVARAANDGGKRRYVWTTGSWLLYEYLEQASAADRKTMEQAIARGDIAWHALPFTWQSEMMSQSLIEGGLALSKDLDRRFGKVTSGAKMTDVPGHTRGLVAPLAKHGVAFLEIGVNGGSTAAKLPPLFLWKAHSGATLPVMYHWDYSGTTRIPGADTVLATRVRDDNSGPHKAAEIDEIHAELTAQFPKAEIVACDLSEMARAIAPHRDALPVIEQEIGDTWIYGVASDPLKVARYREVMRLREKWLAAGKFKLGDSTDSALLRKLLLEVEHTWGTDTKTWLDFDTYKPADLEKKLDTKNYKVVQFSWQEKRQDLLDAVATLPEDLRSEAQSALQVLKPQEPVAAQAAAAGTPIETTHFLVAIDARTGAIIKLKNKATGREWASEANPIALLAYQTLSAQDYDAFIKSYLTTTADWAYKDFGKPNIQKLGAASRTWLPQSATVQRQETETAHRILVTPGFQDQEAFDAGLAAFPRKVYVELLMPKAEPTIHVTVSWFQKPPTRLPEALWLTFNPLVTDQKGWVLDKSNEDASPFDVVESGNRHMHALMRGFEYREGPDAFAVETLDAPVVALGQRTPLLFSNQQPDLSLGVHSCLFNNAWGTNYIMWYGEDAQFRYVLKA